MSGFSRQKKLAIIQSLRRLRRQRRLSNERLTFQDVESVVWGLPQSRLERFFGYVNRKISAWQGKR
jgi:hypothetical protein